MLWNIPFSSHCDADQSVCDVNSLLVFQKLSGMHTMWPQLDYRIVMPNSL
jgi:hypothetical protein